MSLFKRFRVLAAFLFVFAGSSLSNAATLYWKANSGTTNFDNNFGSWDPGNGGSWYWNPAGNDLVFENTGNQTLNNNTTAYSSYTLKFASGASTYTINGNAIKLMGTTSIQNDSSATQTINTDLSADNGAREVNPVSGNLVIGGANFYLGTGSGGEIRVWGNNGKTLTLNTVVSENGNLSIQQNSTVILQKTNTYSGGTFIHAGELQVSNNARIGTGTINIGGTNLASSSSQANALYLGTASSSGGINNTNAINVYSAGGTTTLGSRNTSGVNTNSGAVTLNRSITIDTASGGSLAFTGVLSGSGGFTKTSGGTLVLSGANTYTGTTTISAGTVTVGNGGNTGQLGTGNITNNSALVFNRTGTFSVTNIISGSGTLTKTNTGTMTLSGANTYTGATTISAGTLTLGAANVIGDSSAVTVNGGDFNLGAQAETLHSVTMSSGTMTRGGATLTLANASSFTGGTVTNSSVSSRINANGALTLGAVTFLYTSTSGSTNLTTLVLSNNISTTGTGTTVFSNSAAVLNSARINLNNAIRDFNVGTGATVDVGWGLYTATSASGGITKSGDGTLILRSTNNSFGGGVTVSNGVVQVAADGVLGSGRLTLAGGTFASLDSNARAVTNALTIGGNVTLGQTSVGTGSLTFSGSTDLGTATRTITVNTNTTISGAISGNGGLTKGGTGNLTLAGANTYTGGTTVGAGTLQIGAGGTSGMVTGNITNNAAVAFDRSNDDTYSGILSGSGTLTKSSAGKLTLTGANTLTGGTTVSAGTLEIGSGSTTGSLTGNITNSGTVAFNRSDDLTYSSVLSGAGALTKGGTGNLTLAGVNTYTGKSTINGGTVSVAAASGLGGNPGAGTANQITLNGGTMQVTTGFTANANAGITIGASGGTVNVASGQTLVQGGGLSGSGAFSKTGDGTLNLTNTAGNYSGTMTISGGVVRANTSLGNATVTVANGGKLGGAGSVGAVTVQSGGRLTPGNSPGNLTVSSLTLDAGSGYDWEIDNVSGSAGTNWDLVTVGGGSGTVTISSTSGSPHTIYISGAGTGFSNTTSYSWTIIDAGSLSGFAANKFAVNFTTLGGVTPTGSFSFTDSSGNLMLNYTAAAGSYDLSVAANTTQTQSEASGGATKLTGAVALNKLGAGTLTLTNSANDYTGVTTVKAGTLQINVAAPNAAAGALGNANSAVVLGDTGSASNAVFNFGAAVDNARGISVAAGTGTADRVISTTIGSGTATQSGTVTANTNTIFSAASGGTLLVSGVISQGGALTISNSGTVAFTGINTYTNTTTILSGSTLRIGNNAALGSTDGNTVVNSGGTLALSNGITISEALNLSGTGVSGTQGALRNASGNNTVSGAITLGSGGASIMNAINGSTLTLTGGITGAGQALTLGGTGGTTGTRTISISGSGINTGTGGSLIKNDDAMTLVITAASDYTGGTTISAGTVRIGHNSALGTGAITFTGTTGTLTSTDGVNRTLANNLVISNSTSTTFGASSTFTGDLSFTGTVNLAGGTRSLALSQNAAFSGVVSNGGITKSGSGTLTLSGTNTYTGTTTVSAGTLVLTNGSAIVDTGSVSLANVASAILQVNSSETIGSLQGGGTTGGNVNIASGQTLTVAEAGTNTYSGVIGGAGGLTKTGAGVLLLGAANTFTGGIVVNAGTLAITNGAGNRLGGITSGTTNAAALTLNGGTLQVRQGFQIAGERGFTIGANGGTIDVISGVDYGGPNIISGPGNTLTKTGAGTLYSTAANTIGGLIVAGGTFKAENANALQNANVTLNGGNVTFGLSVTNFTFGGLTATNSGAGYDLALTNVTTGAAVALTIGNGGGSSTYAGVLSGAGSIIKTGTGTFTLSSINTYTGATTINAGTLAFSTSGSLYSGGSSAGTITVNNGGTLLFNRQDVFGNADSASAVTITVNSGGLINNGGVFNNLNNLTLNGGELRASGGSSGGWNAYLLNNVTVGGSSASSITANTSVNANNSILLSRAGTTTFNVGSTGDAAGDLLVSARLTDGNGVTGSLTKTGAGKMVLSGANTYTGNTSVSAGELALGAANVLSDSTAVSVTGGTLNMGANNDTVSSFTLNGGTLGGTGTLTASTYALQSGTLNAVLGVGSITVSSGTTTLGSASRLNSSSSLAVNSGTLTLGGNESVAGLSGSGGTIALGGNTLTTTSNSDSSAAAAITGTGGALTKAGTGNLTLSGNSSYTGTTTINAGTITISHANALGNTTGSTTVADQATLALSGGINTAENISITGTGVGGNGALRNVSGVNTNSGTVSLAGNATISADNETTLQLGNIDNGVNTRAVTFDGAGTIRLTGNFANTGTNTTWQKNGTGELIISNTSANTAGLQLQVANGKVTLAAGTFSTNTTTSTRGLDFGLTSAGAGSSGNTEFYVNGGVTMSNTVYVASGTGTRTMGTESTSGTATYNGEIYLDNNLVLSAANGGEAAFSGNIVNNGAITKAGAGKVSLSGANTSVGAILINAGTLAISGGSAINNANSVAVASGATFEVNGSETINALSGAGSVVLASGQQLRSRFDTTSSTFSGGMSGAGQFLKGGSGTLVLSGANSYSGLTTFEAGTILAGHNDAFGTSTVMFDWSDNSAKTLAANGATARTIANSIQIYNNLTLGQSTVNTGSLTFSGGVALGDEVGTREITVADGTSHTFSGVVSGLRGIVKKGAGSLTLSGNNTFSGASYLVGGTTVLSGNTGAGSGGLFLGETSGSDTATLALTNGVSLSNALEVRAGSTGLAKIVAQGGANTLSGALTGSKSFEMEAADGATLTVSGNISGGNTIGIRGAGTGKVVLTGNNNTSTKFDLWSGTLEAGAADDLGNNTGNFIGNKLYFDGGTLGATGTFTLGGANGITLGAGGGGIRVAADQTLTLQGYITDGSSTGVTFTKSGAGTLFLDKTEINDFSGTTLVVSEGTLSTWNPGLLSSTVQLGGSATTGTYRFQKTDGAGSTGVNFQVNAGGGQIDVGTDDLTASGTVSGSGALTKIGSGRLTLSGANTNSGGVTLSAGKLRLNSTNALGTGSLAQSSGASTLEINTTGTISNAMSIYNVNTLQTVTLSGNKTLNNATYDVATSTTTTESGLLSGTSGVTKVGAGTLILSGSSGNTFSGASAVNAGTLQLQKTSGNAISGSSIAVNSGGTLLLGASNQIGNETALNLAGGTFSLAGNTDTVGRLTVSANSIFDFGTAGGSATTFTFADFDTAAYGNNTYVMTVNNAAVGSSIVFNTNYDGNATFNSFASKIQYGGSGQFGQISFGAGTTTLLVAIPDARVYSAAVALIFLIGIAEVRRRRQRATRGEA